MLQSERANKECEVGDMGSTAAAEDNSQMVHCLLLSTEIAFELWLIRPNSRRCAQLQDNSSMPGASGAGRTLYGVPAVSEVEVECLYRRREDGI
jgi:hypothetical protein